MGTAERRSSLLKVLCRRRYETISNLAAEFGVSERTIRRDIEVLSYTEPIYTRTGRYGGGVYVVEGYTMDRMYMSDKELRLLRKLYALSDEHDFLTDDELNIFQRIITNYTKPVYAKEERK